ncbi:MAG TPA: type II methionyl aminopeptidase [Candidatus Nanoarchaeia archaeon]|nr:type II methionyl aminopeptidase [Candidatus Nanoarchaeia archaeon]
MVTFEDHIEAGRIAKKVREWGKSLFKEGEKLLDIAETVENKIREEGAQPAFPTCLSLNGLAAHFTPRINDPLTLTKGDVVKFDMGVHVNGKVADTACTLEIGTNNHTKLIEASKEALDNAIKIMKPGVVLRDIGKVISKTITSKGYTPIINLSGHGVSDYIVHDDPSIPNYDNKDETTLTEGQSIACEPFATTGQGMVKDGKPCGIYMIINKKNVRSEQARQLIKYLETTFNTLPFTPRCVKTPGAMILINQLEREGILKQYTQLPERSNGMVSQAEHTIIIGHGQIT